MNALTQVKALAGQARGALKARAPMSDASRRLLMLVLGAALLLTALASLWLWRDDASYRPVFGQSEQVSAADMMAVLDASKIPYRLHPQSGQVLVPADALGRVRMELASKGVVARLPAGLELLDQNDPLGVSQFVQDVRFRRGLEGELAQSVMALEPVAAARVHLSLPRATSFVSAPSDKASASVVVTLKPGQTLSREQIAAVVKLVAGSVSVLSPSQVTLVDQAGNLLSARVELGEDGMPATASESGARLRDEALANIDALLAPVVGTGNYKASVTVALNNDRIEETREQFGEAPKVTNEARREENSSDRSAIGVPGSLSNRPMPVDASAPAGELSGNSRNAVTRQYAYDRNIVHVKKARGELKQLSVAVMLNQAAAPTKGGWQAADIARIEDTLKKGLGVNAERGDALVVSVLPFAGVPVAAPWWEEQALWLDGARALAWVFGLLLAYLLLVRPFIRLFTRRFERTPEHTVSEEGVPALPAGAVAKLPPGAVAKLPPAAERTQVHASEDVVSPLLEDYDLPPAGSSVDVLVEHLKELAAKEPERVAEVVKQWIQKDGRKPA